MLYVQMDPITVVESTWWILQSLLHTNFPKEPPQHVELAIVVEVFKACSFAFNLISDSTYVVNALKHLECAGPLKASSLVHALFVKLQCLLWQRKHPFFVQHI